MNLTGVVKISVVYRGCDFYTYRNTLVPRVGEILAIGSEWYVVNQVIWTPREDDVSLVVVSHTKTKLDAPKETEITNGKILRIKDVIEKTGLSRTTIYKRVKDGLFPKQVNLAGRAIGWREEDIDRWIYIRGDDGDRFTFVRQVYK